MTVPVEWWIIAVGTVSACAYFSYNAGYNIGHEEGISNTLIHLDQQGVIELVVEDEE